jgi:hypothetical protein
MTYLYAALHTLGVGIRDRAEAAHTRDRERGASTIEVVFWAVSLLALAGIVYAAISAYISSKVSSIK